MADAPRRRNSSIKVTSRSIIQTAAVAASSSIVVGGAGRSNSGSSAVLALKQLDLQNVGFHGRSSQQGTLRKCLEQCCEEKRRVSVAVVKGLSGVGKSRLVESTFQSHFAASGGNGMLCVGKCNQVPSKRPWQAVVDAFDHLITSVSRSDRFETVKKALIDGLGSEASFLASVVPSLAEVLDVTPQPRDENFKPEFAFAWSTKLFRRVLLEVCNQRHPIVMFIDDVQWADESSLALIDALASCGRRGLLFVLAYRSDEMNIDHVLYGTISRLEENAISISVEEMQVDELNELVASALDTNSEKTLSLAEVIHKKTNGNVLFAMELLKRLEEDGLLSFSLPTFRWDWDVEDILAETDISLNMVGLLVQKLQKLQKRVRGALIAGACIGTSFDFHAIEYLLISSDVATDAMASDIKTEEESEKLFSKIDGSHQLLTALEDAVLEGLLDSRADSHVYKFAHDQVQAAVYTLLPVGPSRCILHAEVGQYFLNRFHSSNDSYDLLAAVDQFNQIQCEAALGTARRYEIACMNVQASKIVSSLSAFDAAISYKEAAEENLSRIGAWQEHYDLMLQVCSSLAELYLSVGKIESSRKLSNTVVENGRCLKDKLRSYMTLIKCDNADGNYLQLLDSAIDVLGLLGEPFQSNPNKDAMMKEYRRSKSALLTLKDPNWWQQLESTADPELQAIMNILMEVTWTAFGLARFELVFCCGIRMAKLTMQRGLCEASPFGIVMYGAFLAVRQDASAEGFSISEDAVKLAERVRCKWQRGRTMIAQCHWLWTIRCPVHTVLNRAITAFHDCIDDGDVAAASQCLLNYLWNYFWSGLPLDPLLKDHKSVVEFLLEFNQHSALVMHTSGSVIVRIMAGTTPRRNAFDFVDKAKDKKWGLSKAVTVWVKNVVAVYFNDVEAMKGGEEDVWKNAMAIHITAMETCVKFFFLGMAECILFESTRNGRYKRRAKRMLKQLICWADKGNVNCVHMVFLVKAELNRALRKPESVVVKAYENGIVSATRGGFTNHTALANERLGLYLRERGDAQQSAYYMERSVALYTLWNAKAKVDDIAKRYGHHLTDASRESTITGHYLGRSRFTSASTGMFRGKWSAVMRSNRRFGSTGETDSQSFTESQRSTIFDAASSPPSAEFGSDGRRLADSEAHTKEPVSRDHMAVIGEISYS